MNLSELIWVKMLGQSLPNHVLLREVFGIVFLLGYFLALPPLFAKTCLKGFYERMQAGKYSFFMFISLFALLLPIKMLFRWFLNLKYFLATPLFNI